jgi:hypothetical protein
VATGAGLLNLCHVAKLSSAATGVRIDVVGFDTGRGLPRPQDYRDHPELFQEGDYPMDFEALQKRLPGNGRLVLGPIGETAPKFIKNLNADAPVGFAAVDVDYYSSAKDALKLLTAADPEKYMPLTLLCLDDITDGFQNQWCGELLAIEEFNNSQQWRTIERVASPNHGGSSKARAGSIRYSFCTCWIIPAFRRRARRGRDNHIPPCPPSGLPPASGSVWARK